VALAGSAIRSAQEIARSTYHRFTPHEKRETEEREFDHLSTTMSATHAEPRKGVHSKVKLTAAKSRAGAQSSAPLYDQLKKAGKASHGKPKQNNKGNKGLDR
jgi:hypothetical protein